MKNKDIATIAEMAAMGMCVPVTEEQVNPVTQYLLGTISAMYPGDFSLSRFHVAFDILSDRIRKYTSTNDVAYITTFTVYGLPVITYVLKSRAEGDEKYPDPFATDYGTGYPCAFCYAFNPLDDMCSEFGDCFFQKHPDGHYHRVS